MSSLSDYIKAKFAIGEDIFLEALRLSPNARGYISGAISEFLLRDFITSKGYEIMRIKEKWEGDKHPNHHGDFYVRRKGTKDWFVLESKGVKSNSEKWHKLFNKDNLISFLAKHIKRTPFKSEKDIIHFVSENLKSFEKEYGSNFYTLNDVRKYKEASRTTQKGEDMKLLRKLSPSELERALNKRLAYVMQFVHVLETHLVSGGSKKSARTQATPRSDEFHLLALDLYLRTGKHQFIFANPKLLQPSGSDKNHLQQNYIVDILVKTIKEEPKPVVPWTNNFDEVFSTLKKPVNEKDMQIDERNGEDVEIDEE